MKRKNTFLLIALMVGLFSSSSHAETVIFSDGETNSIIITTNEAIVFDYLEHSENLTARPVHLAHDKASIIAFAKGIAIAGPCELIFTNSALLTFHRIQSSVIKTLALAKDETNVVVVPFNRVLKVFGAEAGCGTGRMTIQKDGRTYAVNMEGSSRSGGFEFTGPLTVAMIGYTPSCPTVESWCQIFSYYLTEDFVQISAEGYLKVPPGTSEVVVEKSTDLMRWFPAMIQSTATSDAAAYYRLRIQK